MVKQKDIIHPCYINLTDVIEKYQGIWMCDKTWVRVISAPYPDVINSVGFLHTTFNCTIHRHAAECGTHNALGIFVHHFSMSCPYNSGKQGKVFFYYWQVSGKPLAAPSGPHDCEDVHVRVRPIRLSTTKQEDSLPLPNLLQSTANHRAHARDNKENCNGGNYIDGKGGGDGKSGDGGVLAAAE
jgi:hypothetical protein